MYSAAVLERVRHPQRVGTLPADAADVGTGQSGDPEGTMVRIQVRVDGNRVVAARFKVFGCSAAIASAALVAEWLDGLATADSDGITPERVVAYLALPDERAHVAGVAVDAARRALRDVAERTGRQS